MNYNVRIELINDDWSDMVMTKEDFELLFKQLGVHESKFVVAGDVSGSGVIIDKDCICRIDYEECESEGEKWHQLWSSI